MPKRTVYFSSLSDKIIADENDVVRVVVEKHPALEDGPVELEVLPTEADEIVKSGLDVVSLKVHRGGDIKSVVMDTDEFNNLASVSDMATVLREAESAYIPARKAPVAAKPSTKTTDKLDYASLEHAGKPHRGKTTEEEKEAVRNNLDGINERLMRDGMRTIELSNPEHVVRYGLEELPRQSDE